MSDDEKLWIAHARQGDDAAFSQLVEAYQRPVYNVCYRMLGDPAEAERSGHGRMEGTIVQTVDGRHHQAVGQVLAESPDAALIDFVIRVSTAAR